MTNTSILAAFERMWQHVIAIVGNKSDLDHTHDDMYYTEAEMDNFIDTALNAAKSYTDESAVAYSLSKNGTTIILSGTDDSVSTIEESVTVATDDNAGNVVLQSSAAIASMSEAVKQELIEATLASLTTETLTFVLDDGSTVTKEVVVK